MLDNGKQFKFGGHVFILCAWLCALWNSRQEWELLLPSVWTHSTVPLEIFNILTHKLLVVWEGVNRWWLPVWRSFFSAHFLHSSRCLAQERLTSLSSLSSRWLEEITSIRMRAWHASISPERVNDCLFACFCVAVSTCVMFSFKSVFPVYVNPSSPWLLFFTF